MKSLVSIVVRTLNEARHLPELLAGIKQQETGGLDVEVVIVDSGSTDETLHIAKSHDCRIVRISKEDFTFGRSLNVGCEAAKGEYLVFVSGHCIPVNGHWIRELVEPVRAQQVAYSYGRQVGAPSTKYSEFRLLMKHFPAQSKIPQQGFFCNNANAAIDAAVWRSHRFDEKLTGLEDMDLAKRLVENGMLVGYVADAPVYHIHDEPWRWVKTRYEREAVALQKIMPEVHVHLRDFFRYLISSLLLDCGAALRERVLLKKFGEIFMFRLMQYWGTYRGNHEHRKLSRKMKETYFFPR